MHKIRKKAFPKMLLCLFKAVIWCHYIIAHFFDCIFGKDGKIIYNLPGKSGIVFKKKTAKKLRKNEICTVRI